MNESWPESNVVMDVVFSSGYQMYIECHMLDIILRTILLTQQTNQFPVDEAHHCPRHKVAAMGNIAEGIKHSSGKHTKVTHPESRVFCHVFVYK